MRLKWILFIILLTTTFTKAQAVCGVESFRTFDGDEAVTLAYILKNTSIATKHTSGSNVTWKLTQLNCRQTNRGVMPDLMPVYACPTPGGVGAITAKSLFDAMLELGVLPDGAAGHVFQAAKSIRCQLNKNGSGGTAINPRCILKAAWADECG